MCYHVYRNKETTPTKEKESVDTMKNNIIKLEEMREVFEAIVKELLEKDPVWMRFDHKQAWYTGTIDGQFGLLKSYSTIVAVIDTTNHKYYELGKWSPTTSKQVTQFFNRYYSSFERYLLIS